MESVEEVCERISLINRAQVVLEGNVSDIKQQHKKNIYAITLANDKELPANDRLYSIQGIECNVTHIALQQGVEVRDVIAWLNGNCSLAGFHELLPSMNEIFIETVKSLNS